MASVDARLDNKEEPAMGTFEWGTEESWEEAKVSRQRADGPEEKERPGASKEPLREHPVGEERGQMQLESLET